MGLNLKCPEMVLRQCQSGKMLSHCIATTQDWRRGGEEGARQIISKKLCQFASNLILDAPFTFFF